MEMAELSGALEAILFVAGEPVALADLARALEVTREALEEAVAALTSQYDFERRGLRLMRYADAIQLATRPEYARYIERLLSPVQKQSLSQAALETLSVVAYRQPVTKAEVEAVRGVKCDYSIQSLVEKRLIHEVGRKETLGRPILYGTTEDFLRHFGIPTLEQLPALPDPEPAEAEGAREAGA